MRALSSTSQASIASGYVPSILLLELMTSPVIRANSTPWTVSYNGNEWLGAGTFGALQQIVDEVGDQQGMTFGMTAVPQDAVALALQDDIRGCACTLSLAILDPSTKAIVDVLQLFAGSLDQMPITYGPETASIGATAIHRGETFSRPKPVRNTDGDQQRIYPGDTSRRFVVDQSQKQDTWPAASFFRQ